MGVVSAFIRYAMGNESFEKIYAGNWIASTGSELLALLMFIIIAVYMIWDSLRGKPEN